MDGNDCQYTIRILNLIMNFAPLPDTRPSEEELRLADRLDSLNRSLQSLKRKLDALRYRNKADAMPLDILVLYSNLLQNAEELADSLRATIMPEATDRKRT